MFLIKNLIFVFIILFNSLVIAKTFTIEEKEGIKLYKTAFELLKKNKTVEGIKYLDECIKIAPNFVDAYIIKGRALNYLGSYEEAIKEIDKALNINYEEYEQLKNSKALTEKAFSLYALKKYQESFDCSNTALSYYDKNPRTYFIRAAVYGVFGKYDLAINDFDKRLELDPNNPNNDETYLNRFCPLFNLGRYEEALETCNMALKITDNPNNLQQPYSKKARVLNKLGRYEEALENANKALELNPKDLFAIDAKNEAMRLLKK